MSEPQSSKKVGDEGPSSAMVALFALAISSLVANLYYAQPLVSSIGPDIGVSPELAGSVVSVTQVGYGAGLFFLVSLADLVENKRLVLVTMGVAIVGLFGAATAHSAWVFFLSSFFMGLCTTGAQILLPYIAHLTPVHRRGRVVGNIMGCLFAGIMLARPMALFVAGRFGWRAIFFSSGVLMLCLAVMLAVIMPSSRPQGGVHYGRILASMVRLLRDLPAVRRRSVYQSLLFCVFNMFWTSAPLLLADRFGMGAYSIGLFALAGAGGALAAPWAGRRADKGLTVSTSRWALLMVFAAFIGAGVAGAVATLIGLLACTVLLDVGVQTNMILSQRIVFTVPTAIAGRANGIYMTVMFAGGALGAVLGTILYEWGGWSAVAGGGASLGLLALALFCLEPRASGKESNS
ncbi:MAG: MFS transporter [Desulfovibrionaceae bacterium]